MGVAHAPRKISGASWKVDGVETVAGEVSAVLLAFFNAAIYVTDGV